MAASRELVRRICEEAEAAGGALAFDRFMELALYEPGLGYYAGGTRKFGHDGDFVTAPETSALFSRCLAVQVAEVLERSGGVVLEFGAGTGILAADMLAELAAREALPDAYLIMEVSGGLRERQARTLAERVPGLLDRVRWLDALPDDAFSGVVVANEVLDAFPVSRFRLRGGIVEGLQVLCDGQALRSAWGPAAPDLRVALERVAATETLGEGYVSEVCQRLGPWLSAAAARLSRGMLLLVDYGYPRRDYYHPQRREGTLQCYYRHRVHDDPLYLPGLQDITAHVDFTAVAEAGIEIGLTLAGFVDQSRFLIGCGLDRFVSEAHAGGVVEGAQATQQARRLILPTEMGERFKVMGLARGLDGPWCGFPQPDLRGRL